MDAVENNSFKITKSLSSLISLYISTVFHVTPVGNYIDYSDKLGDCLSTFYDNMLHHCHTMATILLYLFGLSAS